MPPTPHRLALAITLALSTVVLRDTQASPTPSAPQQQENIHSLQAEKGHTVLLSDPSIDYTNHRDGDIQAITGSAIKVIGRVAGRIVNDGKISSERHDGIDLGPSAITLLNVGTLSGGRHGVNTRREGELTNRGHVSGLNGAGFNSSGTGKITNYGSITGDARTLDADGDGIRIIGNAEIYNVGEIIGKGSLGVDQYGGAHTSEGISIGGGTIFQYAKGTISGADHGIQVSDGNNDPAQRPTVLENHGTIRGQKGFGVRFIGEQVDQVTNNGLIHGGNGYALDLGGGSDTLIVKNGSRFIGWVDGGTTDDDQEHIQLGVDPDTALKADDNLVILDDALGGSFGNSRHFERLQVKEGTWTLTSQDDFSSGAEVLVQTHLINQGSILGTTRVHDGATYGGGGSVGHMRVTGTLEVDPRQGAARIKEHLTLDPGATLSYGIDADGKSATVEVGGTAHLDGALLLKVQTDAPSDRQHTVIKAGKLEGRFASISTNLALLTATAHYSPTQVGVTYTRNNVNLGDLGNTSNGHNAGEALDPWISPSPPAPAPAPVKPPEPIAAVPIITEPESVVSVPVVTQPEPVASVPVITQPEPVASVPVITQPEPVASVPAISPPEPIVSAPVVTSPEPVVSAPAITPELIAEEDLGTELSDEPTQQPSPHSPLRHAALYISAVEAGQALDQLSGGSTAQLRNATLSGSRQVGSSLLTVMRQTEDQGDKVQVMNGGHSRLWVQGLGNSARFDSTHGNHGLRQNTRGLVLGADWALDSEWRLGVLGGQSQSDFKGQRFTGDLDSWHAGAYALRQSGPLALRLGAVYSSYSGKTERRVEFNGYRDRLKGEYDANSQQAFAELGYRFGGADLRVEPFTGLGYERYHRDAFTERGGEAALAVDSQTHGNLNSTFGLRASSITTFDNKMSLSPHLSAGWKHLYGDVGSTTQQKFTVSDRSFKVKGAALDRDSLLLEAGLDLKLSPSQNLGVGYTGEVSSNQRNHGVTGHWRLTF
ncbi:autotransporter domain-containing protein [Pseudomonas sp. QS1027]|uniref:autotransporter outer membrane beta-barrel domain-containing protein n=1 Tax=Pseudomonas sp. QS1027 TaxID=2056244 RepID=UPI000C2FE3B9|nr:autotransporter domain-containing protein [Pseudomonas sp. QS1027]